MDRFLRFSERLLFQRQAHPYSRTAPQARGGPGCLGPSSSSGVRVTVGFRENHAPAWSVCVCVCVRAEDIRWASEGTANMGVLPS